MRIRRIIAGILDLLIMLSIFAILLTIIPLSNSTREKYGKIEKIETSVKSYKELTSSQRSEITSLNYEIEHELVKYYLIMSVVIIIYFVIMPKKRLNQTIGQKRMRIRLVSDNEITTNTFVIRAILNTGLILMIFNPLFLYIFNAIWYSKVTAILFLIQLSYWTISFILFLIKGVTIHDKITKSKFIEVKR